jgi:hypothetical protein
MMGWASRYIQKLCVGETVWFRPTGQSMTGRIESRQLCTVIPIDPTMLEVGDIVLCKVAGNEYLHIVKAVENGRYQIGNCTGPRFNEAFPSAVQHSTPLPRYSWLLHGAARRMKLERRIAKGSVTAAAHSTDRDREAVGVLASPRTLRGSDTFN